MTRSLILAAALAALLAACSEQKKEPAPVAEPAAAPTPAAATAGLTRDEPMALGLTVAQLEDADLLSANGSDLGDVERVDVDSAGKVTGLIVAPTGPGERWVRLPLTGLTIKADGDDHDVVTSMTWEEVKALPAWAP
ncbi:PRC-barrel domain-containing protein [Brevundimonas sp. NPDC090276]|uniref:PRC-barrel domain-containing protein n=1 Tax=Brevundimonas sp. NPDC090276 TaxID=3363956 RepID=UPI00383B65DF